jgi:hypothetical protein
MAFLPSCAAPGDSVTCAILEVARAFSDGPSAFTVIATLVVPIFAALASTAVAVVSVVIANRAKGLAEASEAARVKAETERVDREYEGRMHAAFIEVFGAIAGLAEDLQHQASIWQYAKNLNQYFVARDRPKDASDMRLLAEIASARLLARNADEIQLLNKMRELTLQSRRKEPRVRAAVLSEVWPIVILWQNADGPERTELLARFEELRGIESADAAPSWIEPDIQAV